MSKIDDSGYPKIGAKIIGYRYSVGKDADSDGYWRAGLQVRRMVSADIVREIADRLRNGGAPDYLQTRLDKIRESGSRDGRYFDYGGFFGSREDIIEFVWQANVSDHRPDDEPSCYGLRCESAGITRWSAAILRKVADIEGDRLYVTPRDVIEALDGVRVQYIESEAWTRDDDPDYTPRQLQFVNREAPKSTDALESVGVA